MKIKNLHIIFVILIFSLNISGCVTKLIHDIASKDIPRIDSIYPNLDPIAYNDGRVIIYWDKKTLIESVMGGLGISEFKIVGENGYLASEFVYQTAHIIDLPAGKYAFFMDSEDVKLQIEAGKIYCYKKSTSGLLELKQIEDCLSEMAREDVRCSLKHCYIKTIIPAKDKIFQQYSSNLNHDQISLQAKEFNTSKNKARIYIIRKRFTLGKIKIGLDAKPTIKMYGKSFICYEVSPGGHTLTVSDNWAGEKGFKFNAAGGENYFFYNDTHTFLTNIEGEKLVNKYELAENGFYKSSTE